MPGRETALYALSFILASYDRASPVELTPPIRAEVGRMHDLRDELNARKGMPEMESLLPEERLTLRAVLRGMREALLLAEEQGLDMGKYGLGPAPSVEDIEASLATVSGVAVGA